MTTETIEMMLPVRVGFRKRTIRQDIEITYPDDCTLTCDGFKIVVAKK